MSGWGGDDQGAQHEAIERAVSNYYTGKLRTFGATPGGVDWRDARSQELRFSQLSRVFDGNGGSLIDYGCGYGGLLGFLRDGGWTGRYLGIDLSAAMIEAARAHCADWQDARFLQAAAPDEAADYAVASGIFNVRLDVSKEAWHGYMMDVLANMHQNTSRGFAFNCLTSYSDHDKMRQDLFYADPLFLFDFCKKNFSRNVALLHDYGLYEFTIIVRKHV